MGNRLFNERGADIGHKDHLNLGFTGTIGGKQGHIAFGALLHAGSLISMARAV